MTIEKLLQQERELERAKLNCETASPTQRTGQPSSHDHFMLYILQGRDVP